MATAVQQSYVQLQGTLATILQAERNELVEQVQNATSTTTTETVRSFRHKGDRQSRQVRRRTDETCGSVVLTEIIPRSRGPAERAGTDDGRRIVDTETQHDAQHADVVHTRDDGDTVQVSQCRCERGIRRMEAVREGMGAKVCWTLRNVCLADAKTTYRQRVNHRRL